MLRLVLFLVFLPGVFSLLPESTASSGRIATLRSRPRHELVQSWIAHLDLEGPAIKLLRMNLPPEREKQVLEALSRTLARRGYRPEEFTDTKALSALPDLILSSAQQWLRQEEQEPSPEETRQAREDLAVVLEAIVPEQRTSEPRLPERLDLFEPTLDADGLPQEPAYAAFLIPNETRPQDALSILQKAPKGVYVSVGTERGFMGAANAPQATYLMLLDQDPRAVFFNRVNIALLELAARGNRKEYLRLRLEASHNDWLELLKERTLSPNSKKLLSRPKTWRWWNRKARQDRRGKWNDYYLGENGARKLATYLHNEPGFLKIQKMAQEGRIQAYEMDLKEASKVKQLVQEIQLAGLQLNVLDVSNAWQQRYMGHEALVRLMREFDPAATDSSILLLTTPSHYQGYTFFYLRQTQMQFPHSKVKNTLLDVPPAPKRVLDSPENSWWRSLLRRLLPGKGEADLDTHPRPHQHPRGF